MAISQTSELLLAIKMIICGVFILFGSLFVAFTGIPLIILGIKFTIYRFLDLVDIIRSWYYYAWNY
jgi:hypothetical protein